MRVSHSAFTGSGFQVGNTSSWVLEFERPSGAASGVPQATSLNLIAGQFAPAIDVNYDQHTIVTKSLSIGPGIPLDIPFLLEECKSISLTLYEEHQKVFRSAIRDWVVKGLDITKGRAPVLSQILNHSMILKVHHFDRKLKALSARKSDAYYVIPSEKITFLGDQSFQASTLPLTFTVVGRYSDL